MFLRRIKMADVAEALALVTALVEARIQGTPLQKGVAALNMAFP